MTGTIGLVGTEDAELQALVMACGFRTVILQMDSLASGTGTRGPLPNALLVDVRKDRAILSMVGAVKRRYPSMGIAIVAQALDPELMLEGMRAGVTEAIAEPFTQAAVQSALSRIVVHESVPVQGRIYAVVGAKGGVGATTIAVNLAAALAQTVPSSLLVDMNSAAGDAAVFLGVEPRFTVAEALENTSRLDEAFLRSLVVRSRNGLELLGSSPRMAPGSLDPGRVQSLLDCLGRFYHAVVLDVPRLDAGLLNSLSAATTVFVVANHELPTIRSAHRLVSSLRQRYGERVAVLVNRSDRDAEISRDDIEKTVGVKIAHVFPNDYRQAVAAINKGQPLAEGTQGKLAESFAAFARELSGQRKETQVAESGRLFGWLSPKRSFSS